MQPRRGTPGSNVGEGGGGKALVDVQGKLHAAFRSNQHRLQAARSYLEGQNQVFREQQLVPRPLPLENELVIPDTPTNGWGPAVTHVRLMYKRAETKTAIFRVEFRDASSIAMKVYRVRQGDFDANVASRGDKSPSLDDEGNGDENAEQKRVSAAGSWDHELETSYLALGRRLVRHFKTPSFTLLIGAALISGALERRLLREHSVSVAGPKASGHNVSNQRKARRRSRAVVPTRGGNYDDDEDAALPCVVLLSEWCDTTMFRVICERALTEYTVGGLLLQNLLTLELMLLLFPSFRHNDSHLDNWLVMTIDVPEILRALERTNAGKALAQKARRLVVHYRLNGVDWVFDVEACPFRTLAWDMYYSHVSEEDAAWQNLPPAAVVPRKKTMYAGAERVQTNAYVDVHKMFDSLSYLLEQPRRSDAVENSSNNKPTKRKPAARKSSAKTKLTPMLRELLDFVLPDHLKCEVKGFHSQMSEHMRAWNTFWRTPTEALAHPFFRPYRRCVNPARDLVLESYTVE